MRRTLLLFLCSWGLIALAPEVQADAAGLLPIEFSYDAPSDCPPAANVLSLIQRRSERVTLSKSAPGRERLAISIRRQKAGLVGELTVTRTDETEESRSVLGQSCHEVVEALALTAALSIDPDATMNLGPADGSPPASAQFSPADENPNELSALEPAGPTWVRLGASVSWQSLIEGTTHVGPGVVLEVSRPSPAVLFPLEAWGAVHVLLEPTDPGMPGVSTSFVLARLGYCPLRVGADVAFLLCPTTQLGVVMAEAQGVDGATSSRRFFSTLGVQGRLRALLSGKVSLWLAPSVDVPLTARDFAIEPGPEVLASTRDMGWDLSAGAAYTF